MPNQSTLITLQKYILLATGIPSSSVLRDQLYQLRDQTGDFSQIAPLVDDFMTQQVLQNEKGVSGVLQAIANNGFSLNLTDSEADQLVTDFLAQGIDSWSKLFTFLTTETEIDAELGTILNNRAEAANHFTDLLAERNLDNSYNSTHGAQDTREWLDGIDASNESLLVANASIQSLVNSLITVELSELEQDDNNLGFVINGVSAYDSSGGSVSSAGDVNGDGLADLIVGASSDEPNGKNSGASFVVFGKTDGTVVELSALESGAGGFVIKGADAFDSSGGSVSSAGDVNGDGLSDLIVGASYDDPNGTSSGVSFVVFGKSDGTAVELSDVESSNSGFVINGVDFGDHSGYSVSSAGDVNGDGLADLIVGAYRDDPNGENSGASSVVFGKTDGIAVELSAVESGAGGFVINGVSARDSSGESVSSAGDVNGDGLADLIVGAYRDDPNGDNSGASFVVFGKTDGTAVELSSVESGNGGFVINGVSAYDSSGGSVSSAGDVNGDGLADLIVGASSDDPNGENSGASFVVFGKTDGTAVELSFAESGAGGFVINGADAFDSSGGSVSSAGDVNGDGLADLIVGASGDDPNGNASGASFVVYGKTDGTAVELSDVESGTGGFVINGVDRNDGSVGVIVISARSGNSVSNAGDVNGDGFADLIVGAVGDSPNGFFSGASFVVFGGQGSSATIGTIGDDTLNGDSSANQLIAGAGNDTLIGNGGTDVLRGGAGNDILAIPDLTFASLDGGTGSDTLRFDTVLNLDLRTLADTKLMSIEVIDLTNDDGNSTISLNLTDLLNLNEAQTASDTLVIHGNVGDIVNLDNTSNGQTGSWANAGSGVYEFSAGDIGVIGTVTVDTAVTVNLI